jgi:hypothetical protein
MFIAGFYIFGAIVVLISIFGETNAVELIAKVHGISPIVGKGILAVIAGLALIIAYGLISLSTWGYYLTLAYVLYTCASGLLRGGLGFVTSGEASLQVFFGSIFWSGLVMICLIASRHHFFHSRPAAAGW